MAYPTGAERAGRHDAQMSAPGGGGRKVISNSAGVVAATLTTLEKFVTLLISETNAIGITLPDARDMAGEMVFIKTLVASAAATVTITGAGQTAYSDVTAVSTTDYFVALVSDGLDWKNLAELAPTSGVVTLSSNAGTINKMAGVITSEASTLAAGSAVTYTITNNKVAADDIILLTRLGGTSDEGTEVLLAIPGAGSFTILVENRHASAAFDGTFIIGFAVLKNAA